MLFRSLHDYPVSSLMRAIEKHTKYYFHEVMGVWDQAGIYLTESWVNKSEKGESHQMHTHPNSIISGSFYFDVMDGSGDMMFLNSVINSTTIRFKTKSTEFEQPVFGFGNGDNNQCGV